jgi:hypothetical protein
MSSKGLKDYPVPDQFSEILHDLIREILRN